MLNAKLIVVGGNTQFDEIELKLPVLIGRGLEVDLALPDELISRRHAEIIEENGHLLVRDLGSRNGTFVNNRKIESSAALEPEQLLTLGTITFRAMYQPQNPETNGAAELSETVRINFNDTEQFSGASSVNSRPVAVPSSQQTPEDLETVDLDDYREQQSLNSLSPNDLAARETAYSGQEHQLLQSQTIETILSGENGDVNSSDILRRRFPK